MDYNKLFRRAAELVWEHKFLILLGVLAAFSSAPGGNNGINAGAGGGGFQNGQPPPGTEGSSGLPGFDLIIPSLPNFEGIGWAGMVAIVLLACLILALAVALYVVGTIAHGGLIAGVDTLDRGEKTSLGEAWHAGWQRGWTLIGISILPAIPALVGLVLGLGGLAAAGGLTYGGSISSTLGVPLGGVFAALACILLPIAFILGLLRTFANRAAMLENLGVIDAYGRGVAVLSANLGPVLIIFILQVLISVVLGIFLLLPAVIIALCCLLWPLLILFRGFMTAFFSAAWTLAWREWTAALPKSAT